MKKMETSASSTIAVPGSGLENQGRAASMPRLNAELQVALFYSSTHLEPDFDVVLFVVTF